MNLILFSIYTKMFNTKKEKLDYLKIYGYNLKTWITKRRWVLRFYTIIWDKKYNWISGKRENTKLEFDTKEQVDKYLLDLILENEWISFLKDKWYRMKRADKNYLK